MMIILIIGALSLIMGWKLGAELRRTALKDWSKGGHSALGGGLVIAGALMTPMSGPLGFAVAALGAGIALSTAGWPIILLSWGILTGMLIMMTAAAKKGQPLTVAGAKAATAAAKAAKLAAAEAAANATLDAAGNEIPPTLAYTA